MIASIVLCRLLPCSSCTRGRSGLESRRWRTTHDSLSGNPFGDLGERYLAHGLSWVVNLTLILDLFSVCIAFTLAGSRVLMTLARDGLLRPRRARFARVGGAADPVGHGQLPDHARVPPARRGLLMAATRRRGQPWSWWRIPIVLVAIAVPILSLADRWTRSRPTRTTSRSTSRPPACRSRLPAVSRSGAGSRPP